MPTEKHLGDRAIADSIVQLFLKFEHLESQVRQNSHAIAELTEEVKQLRALVGHKPQKQSEKQRWDDPAWNAIKWVGYFFTAMTLVEAIALFFIPIG